MKTSTAGFNPKTKTKWTSYLATGIAEGFEKSDNLNQIIEAWAYLISTGICWSLQGWFGRQAESLIESGFVDQNGHIDWYQVQKRM